VKCMAILMTVEVILLELCAKVLLPLVTVTVDATKKSHVVCYGVGCDETCKKSKPSISNSRVALRLSKANRCLNVFRVLPRKRIRHPAIE
jgi:hypothetical protein